jgi:class 3 adenylate cyclase
MDRSTEPLALVRLAGHQAGVIFPIIGPSFSVGRDLSNSLCISDDVEVSRHHCIIHAMGASLLIEDRSRNGTFLGGERVAGIAPLPVPSSVKVGHTELAILPYEPSATTATSAMKVSVSEAGSFTAVHTGTIQMRTDAFLVVDVVDSTHLVQTDEPHFAKLVLVLGRTLERSLQREEKPFLKCTGDGFFACYSSPPNALAAARALAPAIRGQVLVEVQLSIALHWGISHLTDYGDRIGNNVHAVFALEKIRHEAPSLKDMTQTGQTSALILMSGPFWAELSDAEQAKAMPIGSYSLKGLEERIPVYRWNDP